MLNKSSYFNLINAANVTSGILSKNFVKSEQEFLSFDCECNGLPILIEADETIFDFEDEQVFELEQSAVCQKVYGHNDLSYVGFTHAYQKFKFLSQYRVKSDFWNEFQMIVEQNRKSIRYVAELKNDISKIGSFQTRNIPHSGHEAIIEAMLAQCDHVVINPVIGPKKAGDVKLDALQMVFENLAKTKYRGKISFMPIMANMFYAGPLEAIHHAVLRQTLGFGLFSIGRDHAGAAGMYMANAAVDLAKRQYDNLDISLMCHQGAAYCQSCDRAVLIGECGCEKSLLQDIAGSDFRDALKRKKTYPFADAKLQDFIRNLNLELFEQ